MAITLSTATEARIQHHLAATGMRSPDELVQLALDALEHSEVENQDELDDDLIAAIDAADSDPRRGIPLEEAFAELRAKHGLK